MSLIKTMDGPDIRLPISGQEPELDIRIVKFDIRSYNVSRGSGKCTVCCSAVTRYCMSRRLLPFSSSDSLHKNGLYFLDIQHVLT